MITGDEHNVRTRLTKRRGPHKDYARDNDYTSVSRPHGNALPYGNGSVK